MLDVVMFGCLLTLAVPYFSNITDVYEKIRANRRDIDKKCPRTKCDKILNKVKKVKASVEVIQTMNLTVLEQMVEMLKNSSTAQQLLDLEPIKACMADPTVSGVINVINVTCATIIIINITVTDTAIIVINITMTIIRPSTPDLKAFSSLPYININMLILMSSPKQGHKKSKLSGRQNFTRKKLSGRST